MIKINHIRRVVPVECCCSDQPRFTVLLSKSYLPLLIIARLNRIIVEPFLRFIIVDRGVFVGGGGKELLLVYSGLSRGDCVQLDVNGLGV